MTDIFDAILDFIMGRFIYCPRCLERLQIRSEVTQSISCSKCGYSIPLAYITNSQKAPPIFVQVFGLPQSGKTTFLDTLGMLLHDMDQQWQTTKYYSRPLTQLTVDHTTKNFSESSQGDIPASTPRRAATQSEVFIYDLHAMPRWGSRILVIMDHAGEQFARLNLDLEDIPFLQHTPVTILLLSLKDLKDAGKRVDDLITSYITTLRTHNVHLAGQRRQLIIAFSKADQLDNLPLELSEYLSSDTTELLHTQHASDHQLSEEQLPAYLQKMQEVNTTIRTWVRGLASGESMLNKLTNQRVDVRFTLISSTGSEPLPPPNTLTPRPRRVLDPFFWMLEYYRQRGSRSTVPATLRTVVETFSPTLRSAWSLILLTLLFIGSLFASSFLAGLSGGSPALVRPGLALLALLIYILANQWVTHPDFTGATGTKAAAQPLKLDPELPPPPPPPPPQAAGVPSVKLPRVAHSVLSTSRLALFFASLSACFVPAAQQVLSQLTLGQLLQVFLVVGGLFTCFQPSTRHRAFSHITLILIACSGALILSSYGSALVLQKFPLPVAAPDVYTAITDVTVIALLVLAAILPLIITTSNNGWYRFALWLIALVFAGLQLAYGSWELQLAFPSAYQMAQQVEVVNIIMAVALALLPLLVLAYFHRFIYLDRLPLLLLALACAVQIHFLGDGATLPTGLALLNFGDPLTLQVSLLLLPAYLHAYVLIMLAALMALRWLSGRPAGPFAFQDHVSLFVLAFLCSQSQNFLRSALIPQGALSPFQDQLFTTNLALVMILTFLVYVGACLSLVLLLFPLVHQIKRLPWLIRSRGDHFAWLTHQLWYQQWLAWASKSLAPLRGALPASRTQTTVNLAQATTWMRTITSRLHRVQVQLPRVLSVLDSVMHIIECLLACATTLVCAFLVGLYGVPIFGDALIDQLVALLFIVFAIITICRIKFPLARGSRFLLLLDIFLYTFFYLGHDFSLIPFTLQNWNAAVVYSSVPILLFVGLCLIMALTSFWWAERALFPGDRRLLQILFTLAIVGSLLQLLSTTLVVTLLALLPLIMGMAIATIEARKNRIPL